MSRRSSTHTAVAEGQLSTMISPLSEDYLRWLAAQIRGDDDGNPGRTYDGLLTIMFEKEFIWRIANDDNRLVDGLELRVDFCHQAGVHLGDAGAFLSKAHPVPPCSFLEVLIALSRRLEFNAGGRASGWAWVLINNLTLHRLGDPVGRGKARQIHDILDRCIWRNYEPNGAGGFFPLHRPFEDQTQVEIWYQMSAYIGEMEERR